jgi:membrane protease subunit (stomatin/prohibitin family)
MAESMLNVAGSFLGSFGAAGNAAHEVERAVGGKLHDAALARAVEEVRPSFRQCARCGRWVCQQVCWNGQANLCDECAPNFETQLAANQAHAKVDAARQQLESKAGMTGYVGNIDMSADSVLSAQTAASNTQAAKTLCGQCGAEVGSSKFCPECGKPVVKAGPAFCPGCGAKATGSKFCGSCGTKMV